MLEDVFGWPPSEQLLIREQLQPQPVSDKLNEILQRLLSGEPLQHITGFTYFDDLRICVSPEVLIPRPETEELVHWISESLPERFDGTIIDWCTGSGCIALALKNRFAQAHVEGYDISAEALKIAEQNAAELQLNVLFEERDALKYQSSGRKVQIIVSNPPYIPHGESDKMHVNVTRFEPHLALFVPDHNALLFYEAITHIAIAELETGGALFFELHEDFAIETEEMVKATDAFQSVEVRNDLYGKQRMLKAVRS